jgi:hypothetical protein
LKQTFWCQGEGHFYVKARFELLNGGGSCRYTRDFSKISVNKINNLRKSDYPKIFLLRAKNIFSKKKYHAIGTKNKHHYLFGGSARNPKISEDANSTVVVATAVVVVVVVVATVVMGTVKKKCPAASPAIAFGCKSRR